MQVSFLSTLLFCTIFSVSAYAGNGNEASIFRDAVLETVNKEHQAVEKPQIDFSVYISSFSEKDFNSRDYSVDMSSGYGKDFVGDALLSIEQAEEDLKVLFQTLETTYGAYYHFGGESAFGAAEQAILQKCRETPELTCDVFTKLIQQQLFFVEDGHFQILGKSSSETMIPYFYQSVPFEKTESGFQSADTKKQVAFVENWNDLDTLFQRAVSEEGQIVYYPVVLQRWNKDKNIRPENLKVHYMDGSIQTLPANIYKSHYDRSDRMVELHENQGIPVLFVRNMGFDEAKNDQMGKEFLAYAEKLKNEPVCILDLRSNGGGNGVLPFKWMEIYTGQKVTTNYSTIKYWSLEDMRAYAQNTDNIYYMSYKTMTEVAGFTPLSDKYMKTYDQPDTFADNENLLVILTGKNTASAAEIFVDIAHNVQNTLIIGENTYGMLISNAYQVIALPNSKIPVQMGSDLSIFPKDNSYFQEFVGFQPDIWTEAGDAEELAVRLLKNMGY